MPTISRRRFLGWLAASVPAAAIVRRAHAAAVDDLAGDPRTLDAVGAAILPTERGSAATTAAVLRFQHWIAGYREGAELLHGYGTSKLERTGQTPATRWAAQLDAIDARSRKLHGRAFADLSLTLQRDLVRSDLAALKSERLPSVGRAPHVALALLAHFYASPEATDLCYGAQIGKQTCRPLSASSRQPLPLARRV
ncbi:MAG: gluconate 2-dehydrogenase subunit 3 family protein [bacterium]